MNIKLYLDGYPYFGCFLDIIRDPRWQVKMAEKYGPVFSFPMMNSTMIFVGNSSIIKQLFPQKAFLKRNKEEKPKSSKYKNLWTVGDDNTWPLLMIGGENWSKRRKHAQTVNITLYMI